MDTSLQVLLLTAVLILLAKTMGQVGSRLGMPLVLGELLAGLLLGPSLFNVWALPWFTSPAELAGHTTSLASIFKVLAGLGVVALMFLAGLETDTAMMRAAVAPAFWAAAGGVALPMIGGTWFAHAVGFAWSEAIFIGTILTATSVTITAQTLINLGTLRSRAGSTILGAAVIDDVLGLIVLSFVIATTARGVAHASTWTGLTLTLLRMALFLGTAFLLGPRLVRFIFQKASQFHGPHSEVAAALVIAFLLAFQAEWLGGMAAITGAYLAGLLVAATPYRDTVIQQLQSMTNSFFGPLFFVSIGLEINARELRGRLGFFAVLLAIALVGKILGCGIGAAATGFTLRDSLAVGVGMVPRGEVGLITASLGFAAGLISRTVYVQVVVLVLVTTLITPPLLRACFGARPTQKAALYRLNMDAPTPAADQVAINSGG